MISCVFFSAICTVFIISVDVTEDVIDYCSGLYLIKVSQSFVLDLWLVSKWKSFSFILERQRQDTLL
jgi:hypothetical protein